MNDGQDYKKDIESNQNGKETYSDECLDDSEFTIVESPYFKTIKLDVRVDKEKLNELLKREVVDDTDDDLTFVAFVTSLFGGDL